MSLKINIEAIMKTYGNMNVAMQINDAVIDSLDNVLVGQQKVKKVVATSLLCSPSSRILLTGNTGTGKTTLSNYLSTSLPSERISVTSDMIPSDIQNQLKDKQSMQILQIDEFNRASGKVQSTFIELFAERQMIIDGTRYEFGDFYVLATQNSADIAGIFNVPQAVYDRFDVNVTFDALTDEEKRRILFRGFTPASRCNIREEYFVIGASLVDHFELSRKDEELIMNIFDFIDNMKANGKKLFAGSNIRAHKFMLRLAKFSALSNGRNYILPSDIADFVPSVYMHRVDQNVARIGDSDLETRFQETSDKILSIRRRRF